MSSTFKTRLQRANADMVFKLLVITAVMFGFGYAMVPL